MSDDTETTTTTSQTSRIKPYAAAAPALNSILAGVNRINPGLSEIEQSALGGLLANAGFLNQFTPQITGLAGDLLGGGIDRTGMAQAGYDALQANLAPIVSGQFLDPWSNPFFGQLTNTIGNDVQSRINAMYAGAGRDPAGAGSYGQALGRGIAEGVAPVFANQYNAERGRQLDAINRLYNAANMTSGLLSGLDQTALANQQAGIGTAGTAQDFANSETMNMLAVEAQRRGIPLQTLAAQMGVALPIGQAFGTTDTTGTQSAMTQVPWYQPVIGGAIAGAGLYGAFNK
jgi:hypothetical protein